ncbi:MAG: sulfatase-like hydrolase/transferase [Kofleriaceae bacterium]
MEPRRDPALRVLRRGVLVGLLAGGSAGVLDAIWSWSAASQFVPGVFSHLRFLLFTGAVYAAAGALAGLVVTTTLLVLGRESRLGDLLAFGWREHVARRARDPREAVAGLSIVLALLPIVGAALVIAFRLASRFLAHRKAPELVVVVAMGASLAAIAVAIPVAFVVARRVEDGLRVIARRVPVIASPFAPLVAGALVVAAGLVVWAVRSWETARVLPLRAPFVGVLALGLAIPLYRPARAIEVLASLLRPAIRRTAWILLPFVLFGLVLALGASPPVIKAASAYTGLSGPVVRVLRKALDRDRDGYAWALGGGDCDDGDASVHPGAPEIPDDGVDQNCIGGDPSSTPPKHDPAFAPVPASVPKDFNVLVITIDTARADHFGMYGYDRPTSPRLDELAKAGTVFDNGWAHAPSTRYSIPAILTGRLPLDVYYDTSVEGWPGIALKATTIAESLAALGFTSLGAITNYWYFDRSRKMDQGFTEYDNSNASRHASVSGAGPEQTRGSSSQQQTDKAIDFVGRHAQERWMLWVHYYDPHYAYEPHAETPSFGSDRVALYDGEIRFTDLHIGRLLDDLRAKGLYDKTVVVVTGDHGEGFGEHGVDLHGYHLYAPQTKVPFVIRVPGLAPRRSALPAGHVDLLPTLVNLAGGSPSSEMMGQSLVGALAGDDAGADSRVVFQQLSYEGNHEMRAGASRTCHVIYNVSPDWSWEAYRIDRDPMETHDVAGAECEETTAALGTWFDADQIPDGAAEALLSTRPPIAAPLDADLGDAVRLLSVEVPPTARRGESIDITWTFEARGRIGAGWKMFVHAQGPSRAMTINGDHRPTRPFEWWKAGQIIRYTTQLAIPRTAPNGTFTILAGMFKGNTRARVTMPNAPFGPVDKDAAPVGRFEVVP